VVLASGNDKTCTITNNDRPASITVTKTVINNNGGAKVVADFPLFVGGSPVTSGVANSFNAPETYTITETADPGYTQSFSGDCDSSGNLSVSPGDAKTCSITNNDIAPTLHIIKTVVNDNGGTAVTASAIVHVKNSGVDVTGSPQAGAGSPGTAYTLNASNYVVSEDAFAGYNVTFSGDCDASGNITLALNANATCTITNNDRPASITVTKTVINDSGRTKVVADFALFVGGTSVISGAANNFSAPASYTVSETADSGYTQTFSGDCDLSGALSLSPGDNKSCTVTNNDIAAAVVVTPVPPNTPATVPAPLVPPAGFVPGLPNTGTSSKL
jgi:hypothetical protein